MSRVIFKNLSFTANGTQSFNLPGAAAKVSFTAVGVGGTPTAWDVDVDGSLGDNHDDTAVELDGHNSGAEALAAVVNKDVTGVVTKINVVLASLTLDDADSLDVQMAILLH